MQFTSNSDGSITISWTPPSINLTSNGLVVTGQRLTPLNVAAPTPYATSGKWPESDQYSGYQGYAVLHVQFGTDSNNTIHDYSQALNTVSIFGQSTISTTYTANLNITGAAQAVTIPATTLNDPRAAGGLYAIGFVAVSWNSAALGTNGTAFAAYEYGTNAQAFQPIPPVNPSSLTHDYNPDGSITMHWNHAKNGTGVLAGYKLKWGSTPGGPYPNIIDCPIAAWPPSSSNTYQYKFAGGTWPLAGETIYYVVQAYDDGSSPVATGVIPPSTVSYSPTNLPVPTALTPPVPPTTPRNPGEGGGGGPNPHLPQPQNKL